LGLSLGASASGHGQTRNAAATSNRAYWRQGREQPPLQVVAAASGSPPTRRQLARGNCVRYKNV
ncbi:hypothetical protein BHE74_00055528, partial [Ensete ventricosum]